MPTTRRRGGNTQARLSFGSQSRVSKPSAAQSTTSQKAKNLEPIASTISRTPSLENVSGSEPAPDTPTEPSRPPVAELALRQQAQAELQQPLSEKDKLALKITPQQIEQYWKAEEKKRRGPRVHHEDLSLQEHILRHFDLSSQFGPCIGITRLKRWRRADSLNLNPPIEVLAVLLDEEKGVSQRAYVDELMS
ncbi:hypothetical protein P168DRAFT_135190 [Aspergillus campestris IBT 28561]|uniref:DNA polymerase delta subunit 4 n=1 Tax=Aspergillus campestris (strain IBT 28561) TaxID=1392248 RepID=A0A2I1D897_ASPC2|nr:uncharacterized protein P168DRAFT_135190 [Aspergillus campestris IBT 28561]PKY06113.1 hypothetical protein P168DRAFT_135190 [Aspergillus campestris IBT 28561]